MASSGRLQAFVTQDIKMPIKILMCVRLCKERQITYICKVIQNRQWALHVYRLHIYKFNQSQIKSIQKKISVASSFLGGRSAFEAHQEQPKLWLTISSLSFKIHHVTASSILEILGSWSLIQATS